MAQRGRPRQSLTVSDEERMLLERWSKRPSSPMGIARRARIVLLSGEGLANTVVAERVGVHQATVVKWRKRFIERRLDGLWDEPRPGASVQTSTLGKIGSEGSGKTPRSLLWPRTCAAAGTPRKRTFGSRDRAGPAETLTRDAGGPRRLATLTSGSGGDRFTPR